MGKVVFQVVATYSTVRLIRILLFTASMTSSISNELQDRELDQSFVVISCHQQAITIHFILFQSITKYQDAFGFDQLRCHGISSWMNFSRSILAPDKLTLEQTLENQWLGHGISPWTNDSQLNRCNGTMCI